ncbi:MAG TPA: amidohydrolase family protein [bacterium]|nr:amidohydrolase family protein [bacterium]
MDLSKIDIKVYNDLAKFPWFMIGDDGKLRVRPDSGVPPVIDDHSHLGWSYFFGGVVDHLKYYGPTQYFYNYDEPQDVLNEKAHPTDAEAKMIEKDIYMMLFRCPPIARAQTVPNLLEEMDRFNVTHIMSLPIEVPIRSRHARQTMAACKTSDRLIPFAAVHPQTPSYEKRIRDMAADGARGLKYHPEFQFCAPDNKRALRIFEVCEELDLPVLCHAGSTGSEPPFMQKLAQMHRYRVVFESFPKLKFILGHSGLNNIDEALAYAKEFEHVYLDLAGQPVNQTRYIIQNADVNKVLYGSDWAFYPMGVTLGRTLVATEGMPEEVRRKVLHDNAARLFKIDN